MNFTSCRNFHLGSQLFFGIARVLHTWFVTSRDILCELSESRSHAIDGPPQLKYPMIVSGAHNWKNCCEFSKILAAWYVLYVRLLMASHSCPSKLGTCEWAQKLTWWTTSNLQRSFLSFFSLRIQEEHNMVCAWRNLNPNLLKPYESRSWLL